MEEIYLGRRCARQELIDMGASEITDFPGYMKLETPEGRYIFEPVARFSAEGTLACDLSQTPDLVVRSHRPMASEAA